MKCEIRSWIISDAVQLAKAMNNKKVQVNLRDGIPFPYTIKDAEDYINSAINADKNSRYSFAITVNNVAVGSIGVFRQRNIHFRTAEMGYYVAEPYWGRGIGTCAVQLTCDYIFNNTDIIRILQNHLQIILLLVESLKKRDLCTRGHSGRML